MSKPFDIELFLAAVLTGYRLKGTDALRHRKPQPRRDSQNKYTLHLLPKPKHRADQP